MTKKQTKRNDRFYDDISRQRYNSGCCSSRAVLILSVLALGIGAVIIWITLKPIGGGDTSATQFHIGSLKLPVSIPHASNLPVPLEYRVHVTDAEISSVLSQIDIPNTSDKQMRVHPNAADLHATITVPIKSALVLQFVPVVNNGHVTIQVRDLTVAGIRALPLATDAVRKSIASALESLLNGQFSGTITRIVLEEGAMSVYFVPKKP